MAASRGGVSLLQLPVLVDGFTAMHTQAALGGLCVYPEANSTWNWEGKVGKNREGIAREGMDLVTTHMHVWNFQTKETITCSFYFDIYFYSPSRIKLS